MQMCEERGGYSKQLARVSEIPPSSKSITAPSTILSPVPVETLPPTTASVDEQSVSDELPSYDIHLSTTSGYGQSRCLHPE